MEDKMGMLLGEDPTHAALKGRRRAEKEIDPSIHLPFDAAGFASCFDTTKCNIDRPFTSKEGFLQSSLVQIK